MAFTGPCGPGWKSTPLLPSTFSKPRVATRDRRGDLVPSAARAEVRSAPPDLMLLAEVLVGLFAAAVGLRLRRAFGANTACAVRAPRPPRSQGMRRIHGGGRGSHWCAPSGARSSRYCTRAASAMKSCTRSNANSTWRSRCSVRWFQKEGASGLPRVRDKSEAPSHAHRCDVASRVRLTKSARSRAGSASPGGGYPNSVRS